MSSGAVASRCVSQPAMMMGPLPLRCCACPRGCTTPVIGEKVVCDFCSGKLHPLRACECRSKEFDCCRDPTSWWSDHHDAGRRCGLLSIHPNKHPQGRTTLTFPSKGERAMMACLARQAAFSEMMSLTAHPEARYGLALRLRTLCRQALPLGSALHLKLCWQLLVHREEQVRNHIQRLVRYDGQSIWRAGGREASEITGESTERGRDGHHWAECTCDPVREIVEGEMLPCLSKVLSQEETRRWLLPLRKTIWICHCGIFYRHLWREALILVHQQRSALRKYLRYMYSRLLVAGEVALRRRHLQLLGA